MRFAKEFLVWIAIWIVGVSVFDYWLELEHGWLMLVGAVTYMVCDGVQEYMRRGR